MMKDSMIPAFPRDATPEARVALLEETAKRLMQKYASDGGASMADVVGVVSRLLVSNLWNVQRIAALERTVRDLEDHLTSGEGRQQ